MAASDVSVELGVCGGNFENEVSFEAQVDRVVGYLNGKLAGAGFGDFEAATGVDQRRFARSSASGPGILAQRFSRGSQQ